MLSWSCKCRVLTARWGTSRSLTAGHKTMMVWLKLLIFSPSALTRERPARQTGNLTEENVPVRVVWVTFLLCGICDSASIWRRLTFLFLCLLSKRDKIILNVNPLHDRILICSLSSPVFFFFNSLSSVFYLLRIMASQSFLQWCVYWKYILLWFF